MLKEYTYNAVFVLRWLASDNVVLENVPEAKGHLANLLVDWVLGWNAGHGQDDLKQLKGQILALALGVL